MKQHASFVTVSTEDLDAARRFYVDGLHWKPLLDVVGEILFFQINHGLVLGLFDARHFAADLDHSEQTQPISGVTLSHNVDSPHEVDSVIAEVLSAGGVVVKPPQAAAFGGYHAHFTDPSGLLWEVAHNPAWRVETDGTVVLGLVDDEGDGSVVHE